MEVREGLPVGLRHHREDEEGVEAGDGGEVEEDPGRTEEGHERLCELDGGKRENMVWFGNGEIPGQQRR